MPMFTNDDFPEELASEFAAIEAELQRIPTIILDDFEVDTDAGLLLFVDALTLSTDQQVLIKERSIEAVAKMQSGVICEDHGSSPLGDVDNIRLGVFDSEDDLIGIWYLGAVVATEGENEYEARFMPYFWLLSDADSASVTCAVACHLLDNAIGADGDLEIQIAALRYVVTTAPGDEIDTRSQAHHDCLICCESFDNESGDTTIPQEGRVEVTLRASA